MKKSLQYQIVHRVEVTPADHAALFAQCERTEDGVTLPDGEHVDRYTLRGVPAKQVDVCLCDPSRETSNTGAPGPTPLVLEIARKMGRYDGEERVRMTVRHWLAWQHNAPLMRDHNGAIQHAMLFVSRNPGTITRDSAAMTHAANSGDPVAVETQFDALSEAGSVVRIAVVWGEHAWSHEWTCLRSNLVGYDLAAIVMWHYERYYRFLPWEDAQAVSVCFAAAHPELSSMTLAEANRLASRDLYRLARDLGWRKLSLRERTKYRLDSQWVRKETLASFTPAVGAGEYTTRAAAGDTDYVRTSHGIVEVE